MPFSRRDFTQIALGSLSLPSLLPAASQMINSRIDGVQLGIQSYSFRDLPLDQAIQAMAADGLGDCELFSPHIEPGGAARVRVATGYLQKLHDWRMSVPLDYFADVKKKFNDAGINIYAYNSSFNDRFTDDEIDRSFLMAKALGADIITASTTLPVAQRVAPFAEKHKMIVAMHGHSNLRDPNQFATPESFAKALAMSSYFRINLDIGHFTAANFDAVDFMRKHHDNIVLIHLKDRKKNQGDNTPWGEGDTPIKQVLLLLKSTQYPIPAFIEYEYNGAGNSQEEVKRCYDYCKQALT